MSDTGESTTHGPDDPGHEGPEWQPWDRASKVVLALGIVAILALVVVFAFLALPH